MTGLYIYNSFVLQKTYFMEKYCYLKTLVMMKLICNILSMEGFTFISFR